MCCIEVVKTWRALVCADAHSPSQERQSLPIFNAERRWSQYQDPPRRLRLGLGDSPCRGGIVRCEMHAELCKIDQSVSTAFYLRRRLQGGSELSSDLPLDPPRAIVATRTQSRTRCADFERDGRKCPRQVLAPKVANMGGDTRFGVWRFTGTL